MVQGARTVFRFVRGEIERGWLVGVDEKAGLLGGGVGVVAESGRSGDGGREQGVMPHRSLRE